MYGSTTYYPRRRFTRGHNWSIALVLIVLSAWLLLAWSRHAPAEPAVDSSGVWPAQGQAAFEVSGQRAQASPDQQPVPIASVAKVMTAWVVLRSWPLGASDDGPSITITDYDVTDLQQSRRRGESVVTVAAGEQLSERQALEALLIPSANNLARVLARRVSGDESTFVDEMNAAAAALKMRHTHYTDPSGFDERTVSTAADQLVLADRAMTLSVFRTIVGMRSASLPVAGEVRNTDALLGHGGFVGIKTGSDDAAGGCFAFRAVRTVGGHTVTVTGVVLGQQGSSEVAAGLAAASGLVDRVLAS